MGELLLLDNKLFQHRDHPSPVNSFVSFSNYKIRMKINIHHILFTKELGLSCYFAAVVVQSLSCVQLFATPWTAMQPKIHLYKKRQIVTDGGGTRHLISQHPEALLLSLKHLTQWH